jgi:hypothetical protein
MSGERRREKRYQSVPLCPFLSAKLPTAAERISHTLAAKMATISDFMPHPLTELWLLFSLYSETFVDRLR